MAAGAAAPRGVRSDYAVLAPQAFMQSRQNLRIGTGMTEDLGREGNGAVIELSFRLDPTDGVNVLHKYYCIRSLFADDTLLSALFCRTKSFEDTE